MLQTICQTFRTRIRGFAGLFLTLTVLEAAPPCPWPGWRGRGNGVAPEADLPVYWDSITNVAWSATLPGEGDSSPIVCRNALFVTAASRDGRQRFVVCFDPRNGKMRWTSRLEASRKTRTYPKSGYAPSTPVTDGARVYAFFDSPGLVCLDAANGSLLWKRDLGPFKTPYNMASSPILCDDRIILVCDVNNGSFIIALARKTGATLWRTPRKNRYSSASPLLIDISGRKQIVVNGKTIVAYRPRDGAELWRCRGMKAYVTPTAVFDGRFVYAVSGRNGPIMAIDPTGRGDVTDTHVTMFLPSGGPYVPSPVMVAGLLFVPGDNGSYRFVDPRRGRIVYKGRLLRGWFSASPLVAGTRIYWPSEKGRTYVLDAARVRDRAFGVRVLAINRLGPADGILASPAAADGRLFLRTRRRLYCIFGRKKAPPPPPAPGPIADFTRLRQRYESLKAPSNDDAKAYLRVEVVDAMARLHSTPVPAFLAEVAMRDNNWNVCQEAATVLASYGADAAPHLLRIATWKRAQPYLKVIAAQGLGRFGGADARAPLLSLGRDPDPLVRIAALDALGRISARLPETVPGNLPLLLAALDDPTETVRGAAVQALARIPDRLGPHRARVLERLRRFARSQNRVLAGQARRALTRAFHQPAPRSPGTHR